MATTGHLYAVAVNASGAPGTGNFAVGTVVDVQHVTPAQAGSVDGTPYRYKITDGNDIEFGTGVFSSSGTVFARTTVSISKISGTVGTTKLTASSSAQLRIIVGVEDFSEYLQLVGGTMTGALNWSAAVTIASASTVNVGAAAGNYIKISGVTTITAFDTIAAGAERFVQHTGAHQLTHNATSFILLGGANITTAAGDISRWVSEGSGNWRMLDFMRAAASPDLSLYAPGSSNFGYLNIPQNSQSAAYTLVLSDAGKHVLHPSADTTARTFTIPANASVAFPVGTAVTFVNQNAGGAITIAITTDTMRLAGAGTTGSRTLAANGIATAIKVTSTEWIISGTGLT